MRLIYDLIANTVVGYTEAEAEVVTDSQMLLDVPKGFDLNKPEDFAKYTLVGKKLVKDEAAHLARHKLQMIGLVRLRFDAKVSAIKADAAPYELETWDIQRAEFVAWSADANAAAPYVRTLAKARGLEVDALMARISAKITGFATLQGTQQACEKRIEAATTLEEVNAIVDEVRAA